MTISHVRQKSNDGVSITPTNDPRSVTNDMKPSSNAHFIPLTINRTRKRSRESLVPIVASSSDESISLWERIQRVRKLGKVSINGTRLDIASVIAVGK